MARSKEVLARLTSLGLFALSLGLVQTAEADFAKPSSVEVFQEEATALTTEATRLYNDDLSTKLWLEPETEVTIIEENAAQDSAGHPLHRVQVEVNDKLEEGLVRADHLDPEVQEGGGNELAGAGEAANIASAAERIMSQPRLADSGLNLQLDIDDVVPTIFSTKFGDHNIFEWNGTGFEETEVGRAILQLPADAVGTVTQEATEAGTQIVFTGVDGVQLVFEARGSRGGVWNPRANEASGGAAESEEESTEFEIPQTIPVEIRSFNQGNVTIRTSTIEVNQDGWIKLSDRNILPIVGSQNIPAVNQVEEFLENDLVFGQEREHIDVIPVTGIITQIKPDGVGLIDIHLTYQTEDGNWHTAIATLDPRIVLEEFDGNGELTSQQDNFSLVDSQGRTSENGIVTGSRTVGVGDEIVVLIQAGDPTKPIDEQSQVLRSPIRVSEGRLPQDALSTGRGTILLWVRGLLVQS